MDELDFDKIAHLSYPLIVKPVDSYSSRGVRKVLTKDELILAFNDAVTISRTKTAVVEEFVEGDELTVDVYIENGYVNFILKDQIIKIAYISDEAFVLVCKQEGDIQKKLTDAQKRSITHLIVEGYIADSDVRYIGDQMLALEILDLRKTTITKVPDYAFCKGELKYGKESLRKVYLPITCTSIGYHAFYGCINLEYLEAKGDVNFNEQSLLFCDKISLCIGSVLLLRYKSIISLKTFEIN